MGNSLKSFKQQPHSTLCEPVLTVSEDENLRVFSFAELKKATKNFRHDRVVDGDDCSYRTFYKGYIDKATYAPFRTQKGIAVSVLDCASSVPLLDREISKERVQSLGSISHPNVVKLLGYSREDHKSQFLVFEYFHKGSLDRHICGKEEALTWETRVKIAIGAAQALAFIHINKNRPLFRELRMYNIMLDEQYNAKLFYLESTRESFKNECRFMGGLEYEAPECVSNHAGWDTKSDVFTFGVILLDLLTGSKKTLLNERSKGLRIGTSVLTDDHNIGEIIDPRLRNCYPVNAATQMSTLITRCTKWNKHQRPLIQEVVDTLHYIAEIKD